MFGAFLDAAMSIPRFMHDEDMQNDAQAFNSGEAGVAREFNSAQAVAQRDWSERMSNTQWQRGAADMRTAGFNPILAGSKGMAPAGVPGGSAASAGAASAGISNSGMAGTNFAAAQVMEDQKDNLKMDTRKKDAERSLASQHYNESQARTGLANEQTATQRELTRKVEAEAASATAAAKGAHLEGEIDETTYGEVMRYIDRAMRSIGGASSIKNILRGPYSEPSGQQPGGLRRR